MIRESETEPKEWVSWLDKEKLPIASTGQGERGGSFHTFIRLAQRV